MSSAAAFHLYVPPERLLEFLGLWEYSSDAGLLEYACASNAQQFVREQRLGPHGVPYQGLAARAEDPAKCAGDGLFFVNFEVDDEDDVREYLAMRGLPIQRGATRRLRIEDVELSLTADPVRLRWEPGHAEFVRVELDSNGVVPSGLFHCAAFIDAVARAAREIGVPAIFRENDGAVGSVWLLDDEVTGVYVPPVFARPERLKEVLPVIRFPVKSTSCFSADPVERAAALWHAREWRGLVPMSEVRDWYGDDSVLVRRIAVGFLGACPRALHDPSPRVRQIACERVEANVTWHEDDSEAHALLWERVHDQDPGVRIAAALAIREFIDPSDVLNLLLRDPAPVVRFAASVMQAMYVY